MKNKEAYNELFDINGCLSQKTIEKYIDGLLDDSSKEIVLQHSKGCPLCSDALDGSRYFDSGRQYSERLGQMRNSEWLKTLTKKTDSKKIYYILTSAAATITLLIGLFYMFQLRESKEVKESKEIAYTNPSTVKIDKDKALHNFQTESQSEVEEYTREVPPRANAPRSPNFIPQGDIKESSKPAMITKQTPEVLASIATEAESVELNDFSVEKPEEEPYLKLEAEDEAKSEFKGYVAKEAASPVKKDETNDRSLSKNKKSAPTEGLAKFQLAETDNFKTYLADSLNKIIPDSLNVQQIVISYTINKEGALENLKLIKGTESRKINAKILKLVKDSPLWMHGKKIDEKSIPTEQILEIQINK